MNSRTLPWSPWLCLLLPILLSACADAAPAADDRLYLLRYAAHLHPESGSAGITLTLSQPRALLRELDFNAPAEFYTDFGGDGELRRDANRLLWRPPAKGGTLTYRVKVDRLRDAAYVERLAGRWAIFRLGHLFPPARARALADSRAEADVRLTGPEGWTVETPFGPGSRAVHRIPSARRFPRPTGWAVAGELGVRRDVISGRRVAVAAPVGEGFRRQDILAFLRWTLPGLIGVFPSFPERLLIVGSGRCMWRGGLSGPRSLYLHPARPLISENGTSTLLHELVHVAMASAPGRSDDWLVEGLAEYYSLEILRRTGGISSKRFEQALNTLSGWADRQGAGLANPSTGADTAFAVLKLHGLAEELSRRGESLDAVVTELLAADRLTGAGLEQALAARGIPNRSGDLP